MSMRKILHDIEQLVSEVRVTQRLVASLGKEARSMNLVKRPKGSMRNELRSNTACLLIRFRLRYDCVARRRAIYLLQRASSRMNHYSSHAWLAKRQAWPEERWLT